MVEFRVRRSVKQGGKAVDIGSVTGILETSTSGRVTSTVARVATGTVSFTLAAANATRLWAFFFNESGTLKIKLGDACSATDYTTSVGAGRSWEMATPYSGIITGILSSGTGNCQVSEVS